MVFFKTFVFKWQERFTSFTAHFLVLDVYFCIQGPPGDGGNDGAPGRNGHRGRRGVQGEKGFRGNDGDEVRITRRRAK